jgi:hypothetical protein
VEKISLAVNNYFAGLEAGSAEGVVTEEAPAEGEAPTEEAAAEAAVEEDATVSGESSGPETASEESEEREPQGSAPETTE